MEQISAVPTQKTTRKLYATTYVVKVLTESSISSGLDYLAFAQMLEDELYVRTFVKEEPVGIEDALPLIADMGGEPSMFGLTEEGEEIE